MRIGIDCRSLQEKYPSGVSLYALQMLRVLLQSAEAQQHTFVFLLHGWSEDRVLVQQRITDALALAVPSPEIEWRYVNMPSKLWTVGSIFGFSFIAQKIFVDCDVVWFPNADFFPLSALKHPRGKKRPIPFIYTIHDYAFIRLSRMQTLKQWWRHVLLRPEQFIQQAAHSLPVSDQTLDDTRRMFGVSKTHLTRLYPILDHISQNESEQQNKEELPSFIEFENGVRVDFAQQPLIVSIATLEPRKNIQTLVDAFLQIEQKYPHAVLLCVGKMTMNQKKQDQLFRAHPRIVWTDYITEGQKWTVMKHARICVYPSLYEGFGFPPLEAQAYNIPVITGSHSSLPEVLGGSALQCDVLNTKSVAHAIEEVLGDTRLRESLVQKGRQNIERFKNHSTAEEFFDILITNREQGTGL